MKITLPKKLSDKNIDGYISDLYDNHKHHPKDNYIFDFTHVEYVGNQELLILSGIFKIFVDSGVSFEIEFFKKGTPNFQMNKRIKRQIIQFWEVWKIWQIAPEGDYVKYFGIDSSSVERLQIELNYYPRLSELYDRHGITPFVILDYVNNYSEVEVQRIISPIYKLNNLVEELLTSNNCHHPFTSNSLSTIITEELYLNFLDHSIQSSFAGLKNYAFMSISFQAKLEEKSLSPKEIQEIKSLNFNTEHPKESKSFFYDSLNKNYKNNPYILFSFLDFGSGIPETLRSQYRDKGTEVNESDILKYAFNHDSSRHPIDDNGTKNTLIPRGLYDAITIVKRYRGLLIVRSNKGKILFDFSETQNVDEAYKDIKQEKLYFPGTLISIYIPAINDVTKINVSTIKPEIEFTKVKSEYKKYLSLDSIANKLKQEKKNLYSSLVTELRKEFGNRNNPSLIILSFKSSEWLEDRVIKKCLYFLISDYQINHNNNVVIINPPKKSLLKEISDEIFSLSEAIKNYKIHPLPLISYDTKADNIEIQWLGIYDEEDSLKLTNLMFPEYTISKPELINPFNAIGHLNEFDNEGNLRSNMPNREELVNYFLKESASIEIKQLLIKHKCVISDIGKSLFFCNGNYYQREFIELTNLTNDKTSCNIATRFLFERLSNHISSFEKFQFLSLASTGHKLLKSLESQKLITSEDYISLDNYYNFEQDLTNEVISSEKKYILICDVISTGHLASKINARLKELGTEIEFIAVIVSTLVETFGDTKSFLKDFQDKIIFLHEFPIPKFRRNKISSEILTKKIIRINPHTNIPITLSIKETGFYESVIFPSKIYYEEKTNEIFIKNRFLDKLTPDSLKVGFLKFNNVLHPYFFDTDIILKSVTEGMLDEIFSAINNKGLSTEKIKVFYPRKSGIQNFNFDLLKKTLKNHSVEHIEIERFGTPEGWRFPHNTNYLNTKIENNICFILDDGSCSGDSIIQMIDEISFYDAKEIVLLCIIGRLHDHKREFFSRISQVKVKNSESINISLYFASHWHVPTYYLDDNPNTKELAWLNEITKLQNTPKPIKAIAEIIKDAIEPKAPQKFTDYKYLPKIKGTSFVPKKELLLVREEIGKVIGYRLYQESFKFFNIFMNKYIIQRKSNNRYKEIELLCATFLYEPYLYDKVKGIMPDVVERIQDFVRVLLFKNPIIFSDLTYEWEKKDIVHLFFIVFKNQELIDELTNEKFIALAKFTLPKESSLNYVLYKLLYYFPTSNNIQNRFSSPILKKLLEVSDDRDLSPQIRVKLKIYRWFVSSLPSTNSYQELLSKLKSNFERIVDLQYHDNNIFNDKQIINSVVLDVGNKIRKNLPYNNELIVIQSHWENIAIFINDILSFTRGFPGFFIDSKILDDLEHKDASLRKIYGEITESIYSEIFNGSEIIKKIDELFVKYILDDSVALKIFSRPITYNSVPVFLSFLRKIEENYTNTNFKAIEDEIINLDFPQFFLEIIFKELYNNLRYSDTGNEIKVYISRIGTKYIKLKVWNAIRKDEMRKGGNNGEKILNNLNNKFLESSYEKYQSPTGYLQIIKIKLL